jgi:hypothetical protein
VHSFLETTSTSTILTTLKPAEEDGVILRLWNCGQYPDQVVLKPAGLVPTFAARETDLLERDRAELPVAGDLVALPVRACGLTTIRLVPG